MPRRDGGGVVDAGTPPPLRKRVLEDLTNTPPPPPITWSRDGLAVEVAAGIARGGQPAASAGRLSTRGGGSARTTTTSVQRFSLKSRRTHMLLWGSGHAPALAHRELRLPPRLAKHLHVNVVRICSCSWPGGSAAARRSPRRRKLCEQSTQDHQEYWLLEAMNRRLIEECGGGAVRVTDKACLQEMEVYFIVQPDTETAIGYVALRRQAQSAAPTPESAGSAERAVCLLLVQLYVDPDFRGSGSATATLRVLLSGLRSVCVPAAVAPRYGRMLGHLGFHAAGLSAAEGTDDGRRQAIFRRSMPRSGGAEN